MTDLRELYRCFWLKAQIEQAFPPTFNCRCSLKSISPSSFEEQSVNETKKPVPNYAGQIVGIEETATGLYRGTYFVIREERNFGGLHLETCELGCEWRVMFHIGPASFKVVPPRDPQSSLIDHQTLKFTLIGEPEATDPKYQTVERRAAAVIHRLRMELDAANKGGEWATEQLNAERATNDALREQRDFFRLHMEEQVAENRRLLKELGELSERVDVALDRSADFCTPDASNKATFPCDPQEPEDFHHAVSIPDDFDGDIHIHHHYHP